MDTHLTSEATTLLCTDQDVSPNSRPATTVGARPAPLPAAFGGRAEGVTLRVQSIACCLAPPISKAVVQLDATTCREANFLGFFSACQPFEALAHSATISSRSGGRISFRPQTTHSRTPKIFYATRPTEAFEREIPRTFAPPCRYSVTWACRGAIRMTLLRISVVGRSKLVIPGRKACRRGKHSRKSQPHVSDRSP